ncbi:Transposon tx1 uncharacterized protein [Thalictrum thalictroides]|uniref:Transposon tx1 uncharacterized protein n=1 Tax=Thalictrum thalictroides TaxID=46969 RepID=A0A7J6XEU3_THATH|nr:Transposon tx1 uncharacterized protein [Thalictrum thalictroides]
MIVFQKCWSFLKGDIMEVVKEFDQTGFLDWRVNTTFITLIPKISGARSIGDFRPISLVGGIYKIITKTLASRLKKVLPSLISPNQSAFIGRRQILDSILVANECLDSRLKSGVNGVLCKIDIAKLYDSIEWSFIEYMMVRMEFPTKWRNWITTCISTASFSILMDGSLKAISKISVAFGKGTRFLH